MLRRCAGCGRELMFLEGGLRPSLCGPYVRAGVQRPPPREKGGK